MSALIAAFGGLLGATTDLFKQAESFCTFVHVCSAGKPPTLLPINAGSTHQDFEKWRILSDEGNSAAKYQIALAYITGYGVPKDFLKGVSLLTESAESGHVDAQTTLASLYTDSSSGLVPDQDKAIFWLSKAIEQGSVDAESQLAGVYVTDNPDFEVNTEKYDYWTKRAASHGALDALVSMCTLSDNATLNQRKRALTYCRAAEARGSKWAGSEADKIESNSAGLVPSP